MGIKSLFVDLGSKFGLRPKNAVESAQAVASSDTSKAQAVDPLLSFQQVLKIASLMRKQGFQFPESQRSYAAEAFATHLSMSTGEVAFGGGIDLYKTRPNGDQNIVGIVFKGDRNNIDNYFAVQIDLNEKGITLPKSIPLKDFLEQIKEQDIDTFFETLPRATLRPGNVVLRAGGGQPPMPV